MLTKTIFSSFIAVLLLSLSAYPAQISRIKTFADGDTLTASDLNAEFNNVVNGVNSINNANIATGAGIVPSKISATIQGAGLSRNSTTGELSVSVDDSSVQISSNQVKVKDAGIVTDKIADANVTTAKIADANVTTAKLASGVVDGTSLEMSGGNIHIKDGGVTTAKIADGAITQAKRASLGQQISSNSGLFTTASGSLVDVTNLSVSITTTGRPVFIALIPDIAGNVGVATNPSNISAGGILEIQRNGSMISRCNYTMTYNPGAELGQYSTSCMTIDTPAAGTYTYKIQARASTGGTTVTVLYMKLAAFEL